jgi:hypothetical protein
LPLIAASPSRSITLPLANTLKNIVAHDYPAQWPQLIPALHAMLTSTEIQNVHAGCVGVLEAVRAFRFVFILWEQKFDSYSRVRFRQKADILPQIVQGLFPTLVSVASQMLQTPPSANVNQEIPTMLHLILKSYKTSIIVHLSNHQQSKESIVPWGQLLFTVVNLQIPKEVVPEDEEDREICEWWKAKKWAYGILGRLFHRWGVLI